MRKLTPAGAPPSTHWYETAGLGMFIHWGLSSVRAVGDLSWSMMRDTPYDAELDNRNKLTPEEYWKQADEFDPRSYDPGLWMRAAGEAGFRYAVLTTRHHDGYALWPSAYGDFSTRTHMGGRDLVRPFVDACRDNGIKVGFYYSPGDWYRERHRRSFGYFETLGLRHEPIELEQWDPDSGMPQQEWVTNEKRKHEEEEGPYVIGQMEELLTRYGDLDVFWYDGGSAMTNERVRELQPNVMINDRGHGAGSGDFSTFECRYEKLEPQAAAAAVRVLHHHHRPVRPLRHPPPRGPELGSRRGGPLPRPLPGARGAGPGRRLGGQLPAQLRPHLERRAAAAGVRAAFGVRRLDEAQRRRSAGLVRWGLARRLQRALQRARGRHLPVLPARFQGKGGGPQLCAAAPGAAAAHRAGAGGRVF